jgi:hypothetical protein
MKEVSLSCLTNFPVANVMRQGTPSGGGFTSHFSLLHDFVVRQILQASESIFQEIDSPVSCVRKTGRWEIGPTSPEHPTIRSLIHWSAVNSNLMRFAFTRWHN